MESLKSTACRACRLRLSKPSSTRSFSKSSLRPYIPPESPTYIDIPKQHQPVVDAVPRPKGVLPVPRELFPAKRPDKPSPQYLANVTPDRLAHNMPKLATEDAKYRLRASEQRKRYLREGLQELHARKVDIDSRITARSNYKKTERARLLTQAEREDARLTNNSVPATMKPARVQALSAADEEALYQARVANHNRIQDEKRDARMDRLHTLYMNARTFITDEKQLMAEIDRQFQDSTSPWQTMGPPDSIEDMIRMARGGSTREGDGGMKALGLPGDTAETARFRTDQERMKKIAERLSGGKM